MTCQEPTVIEGKYRTCERPKGHTGRHMTTYCGKRMYWMEQEDAPGPETFDEWWTDEREEAGKDYVKLGKYALRNVALCAWNAAKGLETGYSPDIEEEE